MSLNTQYSKLNTRKGFTLVEIMFATAVLSLGAVLIYETLFVSAGAFNYYSNYLYLAPQIDEKIWQAQNNLSRFGYAAIIQREGSFAKGSKTFFWSMSYELAEEVKDVELYRIDFLLYWKDGERSTELTRDAYAMYRKEKE